MQGKVFSCSRFENSDIVALKNCNPILQGIQIWKSKDIFFLFSTRKIKIFGTPRRSGCETKHVGDTSPFLPPRSATAWARAARIAGTTRRRPRFGAGLGGSSGKGYASWMELTSLSTASALPSASSIARQPCHPAALSDCAAPARFGGGGAGADCGAPGRRGRWRKAVQWSSAPTDGSGRARGAAARG